jgi:zinc protease
VNRLTLLLIVALPCVAQQTAPKPAAPSVPASYKSIRFAPLRQVQIPKVEETTLPNGMKVYLLENHELPTVRGLALIRTGNLFDPADKVGLATVTGELIRSGGTPAKSGDQIDEELENIAASVESQIGENLASVSFNTLKERTAEVLSTFHDVLTNPAFRQDKLELTRSQLHGSIQRRNDDAHGIAQREYSDAVYGPNTPYGWRLEHATVDNIKREDVEAFYKRYYFPANVIVAVNGDFSAPEMKATLEKLFADWTVKQPPVPAFPKVNSQPKPGIRLAVKTDVTQTSFSLGHLGGVLSDKDYPALEVMADILGGGFQSRLFQKVRTQLGYAYEINAFWGAGYDHPGLFEISGSTKAASTTETLKAIEGELTRIRTQEVTEEELQSAKDTVVNGFVFNFDTPAKTLNRVLTYRYFGYPDDFIFQYQKAVQQVTRADILRVAKQYIDPSKFVTVAVGNPKDFKTPLTSMGPVTNIDLTIPAPAKSAPRSSADGVQATPAAAAVTPPSPQAAANGKGLLAKVVEALGGEAKLASVKDMTQKADLTLAGAGGLRASQTEIWVAPSNYREEDVLPFGKVITWSDGSTGWMSTPQGVGPIPAQEQAQIGFEMFRKWFPLALSGRDPDRTVAEKGGGLVIGDKNGNSVEIALDPATSLPASETYMQPGAPNNTIVETFTDWQESSGVKLPRKVTITQNGKHFADIHVTSVALNQGVTKDQISQKP